MILGGCSSVGRASAFQAEGREFESRRPLHVEQVLLLVHLERASYELALHEPA